MHARMMAAVCGFTPENSHGNQHAKANCTYRFGASDLLGNPRRPCGKSRRC